MKRFFSLLMVVLLVVTLAAPIAYAAQVHYMDGAEKFIFIPGTEEYPTDLFSGFKGVMPGDTLTEQILIHNDVSNDVKIKVYLRSLGAQENTDAFLSQMNLTVQQQEETILFDAPSNETAQLTDWVYLGTVYSGGKITLDVTLEVPITMGNEYQNAIGYVDWEFKIEELPVEPSDPRPPQTGDARFFLYTGLMAFSLLMLVLLLAGKRKQQENQQV